MATSSAKVTMTQRLASRQKELRRFRSEAVVDRAGDGQPADAEELDQATALSRQSRRVGARRASHIGHGGLSA